MTYTGGSWNEAALSELPAIALLKQLGYTYLKPEALEAERTSLSEVVLTRRLEAALKRLNPWLSGDNLHKAVRAVTHVSAASLLEANEQLHTDLTRGKALEQDLGTGKKGQDVHFIDFDDLSRNEFLVTNQFKVKGNKGHIIPDLVCFVNGIPLVVIECKSPTKGVSWLPEAVEQLDRYQELSDKFKGLGAPRLFHAAQVLVVTCDQAASYATVTTPQRFYAEWKSPYPRSLEGLEQELGRKPTAQEVLFHGMLTPANLLDIVRNFVVFERDEKTGRTLRKICRYQQYAAVNKALERVRKARRPSERGGVVWHTQGSGKSLTMLWLAARLRRDPAHDNPTLVVVTDRRDLDEQIERTFRACGFPDPVRADSVKALRELLSGPSGQTVLTTVQKFQELTRASSQPSSRPAGEAQNRDDGLVEDPLPELLTQGERQPRGHGRPPRPENERRVRRDTHPVLSQASNLFVLVDEAHRTQYGGLAANMRHALKNACFFAFTGTPIDKKDRHTIKQFGPYIDTYTIEQAEADGATVKIFYESRLPEMRVAGRSLDALFDRVFADRGKEEREAIKRRYGTESAVAAAPRRIETICLDLIDHYTKFIEPNGFKAQVVACTREAAVLYKETLDRLQAPQSAVVISGTNKDDAHLSKHHTTDDARKELVRRFIKEDDPLKLLVVCDMLLTGFDAPVEQVMYLDSPLKEHTLLQAIARVNRPADKKSYGLVVDYWGVSEDLRQALAIFAPGDIRGALTPKEDELPRLQSRHAAALAIFGKVKDKADLNACVSVLEPEDRRAEFDEAFRRFSQSLDLLLPDPRSLRYLDDLRWLGKIRQAARARFSDSTLDISDCAPKVRKLIEEAIIADGVQILVKEVSILSPEFEEKLEAIGSTEAKASEMEHALKREIHVRLEEDPVFYTSLKERLEQIIEAHKAKRLDAAGRLEQLKLAAQQAKSRAAISADCGLSSTAYALYGLLTGGKPRVAEEQPAYGGRHQDKNKALATELEGTLESFMGIVDWIHKDDVQREMRSRVKRLLKDGGYPADKVGSIAQSMVDLLKVRATP